MSETFKPTPADNYSSQNYGGSSGSNYGSNSNTSYEPTEAPGDAGRTVLVGIVGGLLSAAGYLVYQRLPDDQKEKLHGQVRGMLQQRISEIRSNFNF